MNFDSILAEINALVAEPSVYERRVPEDELRRVAQAMLARGYVPDARVLAAVEKYLQGYALWIVGDVGTGKTSFFRALPVYQPQGRNDRKRVVLNMGRLLGKSVDEVKEFLEYHRDDELVLDDIGKEPLFVEYGTRFEILPWLVEERIEAKPRTHFTSNYGKKYFDERYGYGLFDRIFTAAYFAEWPGQSRRTLAPRVRYTPAVVPSPTPTPRRNAAQDAPGRAGAAGTGDYTPQPPKTPPRTVLPPSRTGTGAEIAPGAGIDPLQGPKQAHRKPQEPPDGPGRVIIPPRAGNAPGAN